MVCEKCEKKLGRVITPDTWKDGARNTTESGGRKLNENKALTAKKARFDPYGKPGKTGFAICRICKSSVHQSGSHYCQGCAYKKGIEDVTEVILHLFTPLGDRTCDLVNYNGSAMGDTVRYRWAKRLVSRPNGTRLYEAIGGRFTNVPRQHCARICAMCGKKVLDTKNYKQTSV